MINVEHEYNYNRYNKNIEEKVEINLQRKSLQLTWKESKSLIQLEKTVRPDDKELNTITIQLEVGDRNRN